MVARETTMQDRFEVHGEHVHDGKWDGRPIPIVNPDDADWYDRLYILSVCQHTGWDAAVYADNLQDAIDELIDYAEEEAPGWLLDDDYEQELRDDGFLEDYISGGNHGRYLSEPVMRDAVLEIHLD